MEKNRIIEILKEKNIRVTDNRVSIFQCLADESHFHTVNEIQEHIKDLNTKSIYNNLKLLIEKGIVDTYSFAGISKYSVSHDYKDNLNSIHIVDGDNVKHIEIEEKVIRDIRSKVKKAGYEPTSVNIFVNIKK